MKQETRPVFVTDDGKVFDKEAKAKEHEDLLDKQRRAFSRLCVWQVNHGFDATEGRGYFSKTLIVSDATQAVIIQWCIDKFGEPLESWYGDSFYEKWHLSVPIANRTVEWALKNEGHTPAYGHRPWELATVSKNSFEWAGLPKSEHPWPRALRGR